MGLRNPILSLLLLSLFMLGTPPSFVGAQEYTYGPPIPLEEEDNSPWEFGFFIAPQIGWMQPTSNKSKDKSFEVESKGTHLGFSWGLLMDYRLGKNLALSTGLEISQSGGGVDVSRIAGTTQGNAAFVRDARFDYKLQYMHIPLALKLRSDALRTGIRIYGEMGLGLGINLSKKADYDVVTVNAQQQEVRYIGKREKLSGSTTITPIQLAMHLGAGVEYPISSTFVLQTGLFFVNGFTPDLTNPRKFSLGYPGDFDDGKIRLNRIGLRLGLKF